MSGRLASPSFLLLLSSALAIVVAGCGNGPGTTDDAGMANDVYWPPMSRLLGPCIADYQCPGEGAFCRTAEMGYPGGQCTNPCTDRTVCDDGAVYNECLQMTGASGMACERYCRNGSDCRTGYSCQVLSQTATGEPRGVCIPVCGSDAECGGSAQCDPYTGRCVAHGMVGTSGGVTGETCTGASSCRSGICRLANEAGQITGFVGGYCQSDCRIPTGYNTSNFFDGDTLPAGTCAGDAICIPAGGQQGNGDLGVCFAACHSATDCRAGYNCINSQAGHTFTNGFCYPMSCLSASCPAGSTCHMGTDAQGNPIGLCG